MSGYGIYLYVWFKIEVRLWAFPVGGGFNDVRISNICKVSSILTPVSLLPWMRKKSIKIQIKKEFPKSVKSKVIVHRWQMILRLFLICWPWAPKQTFGECRKQTNHQSLNLTKSCAAACFKIFHASLSQWPSTIDKVKTKTCIQRQQRSEKEERATWLRSFAENGRWGCRSIEEMKRVEEEKKIQECLERNKEVLNAS